MTVLCEQSAIFLSVRAGPPPPPGPQGFSQTSIFSSVSKAQDTCQKEAKKKKKVGSTLFAPLPKNKAPPPHPPQQQGQSDTAEKLQFVLLLFELFPCCPVYKLT